MNTPQRQWLMRGVVLTIAFLAALEMHMERLRGWGYWILSFLVASLAASGGLWAMGRARSFWRRRSTKEHIVFISAAVAVVLAGSFIINHGKPDEAFNDFVTCCSVLLALLLLGLYRLFSRAVDAVWERFRK